MYEIETTKRMDALYFCECLPGCYQKGITFRMRKSTLGALDHLMMQRRWIDSELGVYRERFCTLLITPYQSRIWNQSAIRPEPNLQSTKGTIRRTKRPTFFGS